MSIRTGILRVGTVVRGVGWLFAVGSFLVGLASAIGEGWQYPPKDSRPWNQYQQGSKSDAPKLLSQQILEDLKPEANNNYGQEKTFSFSSMRWGYVIAGLVIGAIFLGLAYVFAWVLVGFAPES